MPVWQNWHETSAVVKLAPHERVQQWTLGLVVGVPVVMLRVHEDVKSKGKKWAQHWECDSEVHSMEDKT